MVTFLSIFTLVITDFFLHLNFTLTMTLLGLASHLDLVADFDPDYRLSSGLNLGHIDLGSDIDPGADFDPGN